MDQVPGLGMSRKTHGQGVTVAWSPGSSVFDLPTQARFVPKHFSSTTQASLAAEVDDTSYIVISGGTGCNSICPAFGKKACYVLPVSDDGGSSSEIIRVMGGPSIGDIRSRLIRLIPSAPDSSPLFAIRRLLSHRLSPELSDREARDEWRSIVEGKNSIWHGIPQDRKEAIRGFLVYFESEVLRHAHKNFSFRNGSIGNYLLASAQGFFRSLPSAIFFFSSITNSQADILPVLVTNHTATIAVELKDNSTIVGQCNISHPMQSAAPPKTAPALQDGGFDAVESPTLLTQSHNIAFAKQEEKGEGYDLLPSRISRLFYINAYGHEINPAPNPEFLHQLSQRDVLIYSCGSLWTSIMPCLALRGVGLAIARSKSLKAKILLLNSRNDRETHEYTAMSYVHAISTTLRATHVAHKATPPTLPHASDYPISAFITHIVYLKGSSVVVDVSRIHESGIACVEVQDDSGNDVPQFDTRTVQKALQKILQEEDI